jgi:hypothetical protein
MPLLFGQGAWTAAYGFIFNSTLHSQSDFLRSAGLLLTGSLQILVGATDVGLAIALTVAVSDATIGLAGILVLPLSTFIGGVGVYEVGHGVEDLKRGISGLGEYYRQPEGQSP